LRSRHRVAPITARSGLSPEPLAPGHEVFRAAPRQSRRDRFDCLPPAELRLLQRTSGSRRRLRRLRCKHLRRFQRPTSHEVPSPSTLQACGGCLGRACLTRPSGEYRVSHPLDAFISATSRPALFHAGNAHGVHPSELSPLEQPFHLSVTVALLSLTRSQAPPASVSTVHCSRHRIRTALSTRLRPDRLRPPGPKPVRTFRDRSPQSANPRNDRNHLASRRPHRPALFPAPPELAPDQQSFRRTWQVRLSSPPQLAQRLTTVACPKAHHRSLPEGSPL
jgi:hypothetical protein